MTATTRLDIADSVYVLTRDDAGAGGELARLNGGASALLPDADIEAAIERAEDWLMPHAKAIAGDVLEVWDATGRLIGGLGRAGSFTLEQVESEFNRVLASRSGLDRNSFVAHLVLVRELAHHGRVSGVNLNAGAWGVSVDRFAEPHHEAASNAPASPQR